MKLLSVTLMAASLCRAAVYLNFSGAVDPTYSWNLTSQTAACVYFELLQPINEPVRLEVQIASPVPRTISAVLTGQINPYDPNTNYLMGNFESAASADPHNTAVTPVVAFTAPFLPAANYYLLLYTAADDTVWQGFFPYNLTIDPAIGFTAFLVTNLDGTGFDPNNPPASTFYGVNGPAFGFRLVTGAEVDPPPPTGGVPEPSALALTALGVTALLLHRRRRSLAA